jgi:hypothetical protein
VSWCIDGLLRPNFVTILPIGSSYRNSKIVVKVVCQHQPRERRLPVQEREIAQILAIMLDQVAGVEDRGSSRTGQNQFAVWSMRLSLQPNRAGSLPGKRKTPSNAAPLSI